jgi:hypothetical protein
MIVRAFGMPEYGILVISRNPENRLVTKERKHPIL